MGSQRVGHDWATKYFYKWFTTYFLKQKWPQKPRAKSVSRKFSKELRNISYQLHSNDPNKECTYFWKRKNKKWFRKVSSVKACQNIFLMKMNVLYLWWGWGSPGPGPAGRPPSPAPTPTPAPQSGSFQLPCPLPPSPRLYIVSQLDQAEWNSVLGAVQLWNHLEALKKTHAGPQP